MHAGLQAYTESQGPLFKAHAGILVFPYPKLLQLMGFLKLLISPYNPAILAKTLSYAFLSVLSLCPLLVLALGQPAGAPPLSVFIPTPFLAMSSLLAMFSLLLSLPALDSARCLWLCSPSYLQ